MDKRFFIDYTVRTSFENTNENLDSECPKVIIRENEINEYVIKCFDNSDNSLVCSGRVKSNETYYGTRQWFTFWRTEIWDKEGKDLLYEEFFNPKGKVVSVVFDLDELGGTLAWIPYVEEFRKKHNCTVICSTKWNSLFENEYPELIFVPHYTKATNIYAQYCIGVAWDGNPVVMPNDWKKQAFQKLGADILGIDYTEIRPKVTIPECEREIKEKYVCISEFGSGRNKMWIYPNGWQSVVDFLNSKGYRVVVISKEITTLANIIDKSGNKPIVEIIEYLKDAEFFIGVSSGLAWLSWAVETHVVMISDYTPCWFEFQNNITRLYNKDNPIAEIANNHFLLKDTISCSDVIDELKKIIL
jgi:autotransporter strand-loop-strand O-heptosyltransferase